MIRHSHVSFGSLAFAHGLSGRIVKSFNVIGMYVTLGMMGYFCSGNVTS